jgi:exosortase D (VPLPA-CTERM-specific)
MEHSEQTEKKYWKQPAFILLVLAVALSFFAFWSGLANLSERWLKQEEYGYGFFIPLISLWLLWKRRGALISATGAPSWAGLALIMAGSAALILGELTALYYMIQGGFILVLLGLALSYAGYQFFRLSFLPIILLLFAIPLPYFVDSQLSWRLQLVSSELGVIFLRLFDVSVFLEGNVIDLGAYKLQVVEACSGLRYLYPLISISFLMAYMYRGSLWQRFILFISAVPVTILMNSFRIAVIGILVGFWGSDMAEGFLHFFEGWIIFIACLAILLFEVWIFERMGKKRAVLDALGVPDIEKSGEPLYRPVSLSHPLVWGFMVVFISTVLVHMTEERLEEKPDRSEFVSYPLYLNGWIAQESVMETHVEIELGLDDYLLADYRHPELGIVNFYVAYYGSQRKGVSPHSPQVCIPGGGWHITSLDRVDLRLDDGSEFQVVRSVIERNNKRQLVYYWYEQRGRRIANEYLMKAYLLYDALAINRTDGALVRVTTPLLDGEEIDSAEKRLLTFMNKAVPLLKTYVPR